LRKLAFACLGLVAALALPTTALAAQQNTYKVTASVTPKAKASGPAAVKFGFQVSEVTGLQPSAVKRYTIGFGGLKSQGAKAKTCTTAQMTGSDSGCDKKALIGAGKLDNYVYTDSDPSGVNGGFTCAKDLHIWNAGRDKAVLFVGGDPNKCGGVGNLAPIPAKFVKFGNGQALQFEVPATVLHPIPGLTVAIRSVTSNIKNGFFQSVAKAHPVKATFLTEAGQSTTVPATA
jgi:hypothetical protein